ncbi:MAG: sulfurtransferase [Leptolyngbyaceae cyanobacterium SL_7_1]|nr:sulfurtransferase [Leptolyngbyaceae cyanobacterium SL_7_1]
MRFQSATTKHLIAGLCSGVLLSIAPILINHNVNSLEPPRLTSSAEIRPIGNPIDPHTLQQQWIVSPDQAVGLLQQGATLLDARGSNAWNRGVLENSIGVTWQQFSQQEHPHKGKLLEDEAVLTQKLREIGVFNDRPVVVVADPANGWGEDGRIVWMLRTLGHRQAVLVDGGYQALVEQAVPVVAQGETIASTPGDFIIRRTNQWEVDQAELRRLMNANNIVIVDVREPREYQGQTPYGESRGGHIPGAIHLYYRDLLDEQGNLRSRQELLALLQQHNITPDQELQVISYCTGGIRSGWFTAVLTDLGFRAQNYAGSIWEWSAAPVEEYPLQTN